MVKVLVIDTDKTLLDSALHYARSSNIFCITVDNSRDALMKIHCEIPDIVFVSDTMIEASKNRLLVDLRYGCHAYKTSIVVMGCPKACVHIEMLKRLGADDYLVTPFDQDRFVETLGHTASRITKHQRDV